MADLQRIIDATNPVLEAWDMLPTGPTDDNFWRNIAPGIIGMIAHHTLETQDVCLHDTVMLLHLCDRRLQGVDVEDVTESLNERVRTVGTLLDTILKTLEEEGEQK